MKRIEAWQTGDGQIFTDQRAAASHAEQRYGNALTSLAHAAVKVEKYTLMIDFIEANLPKFRELMFLSADRIVEEDE